MSGTRPKGLRAPLHPTPAQLVECRRKHGLTQADAAKIVFSSLRTWSGWECGEFKMHPAIWRWFLHSISKRERDAQ